MPIYLGGADDAGLVGRIVADGLRVIERTGSTPLGSLYRAEYLSGGPVVLLVLPARGSGPEPAEVRSLRAATQIRHPNVAAVRAVGELEDGSTYAVLEEVLGEPLLHLLSAGSVLPLGDGLDLAVQAAAGLEAVHQAGFVHGNVSPSSIVVARAPFGHPRVKLVGFSTNPGRHLAPLDAAAAGYAGPERLGGDPPDERSDVFSLGAVLHHLLSGSPPAGERALGKVPRIARPVLEKALAPNPAARFQTMSELREALERLAAAAATPAKPLLPRAFIRAAAGVLALVAVGALLVPVWTRVATSLTRSAARLAASPSSSSSAPAGTEAGRGDSAPRRDPVREADEERIANESRGGTAASRPAPTGGSRRGGGDEGEALPEALGYVGDTGGPVPSTDTVTRPPPEAAGRAGSRSSIGSSANPPRRAEPPARADPARPLAVLEQYQGLQHAIGDVTRIGLAEHVAEVRPGLLAVHLAAGGMGVPSAHYNLQRLYLAYSAASRDQDSVVLELRRKNEVYGWFTRDGLRYTSADTERR